MPFIIEPFPVAPPAVSSALHTLTQARNGTDEEKKAIGPISQLPKPWIPSTCGPKLRQVLYLWLDDVADWINQQYTWQRDRQIPACWPLHPHLANELAPLAIQRREAETAGDTRPIEDWHRYALPQFLTRMTLTLGHDNCANKGHQDWPGANRHTTYGSEANVDLRQTTYQADHREGLLQPRQAEYDPDGPAASGLSRLDREYLDGLDRDAG